MGWNEYKLLSVEKNLFQKQHIDSHEEKTLVMIKQL
jgi:hypothetical protein